MLQTVKEFFRDEVKKIMANQMETNRRSGALEHVKQRPALIPSVDVYENAAEILLLVDLPGVKKGDLKIDLDKDQVTIEARRRPVREATPYAAEFGSTDFRRSFAMPPAIDRDKVDAELRAGVLRLRLPKSDSARPRQIQVRSA
jgi:HSP20 family protein